MDIQHMTRTRIVDEHGQAFTKSVSVPSSIGRSFWTGEAGKDSVSVASVTKYPYQYHSWTYRAVNVIATNISSLPMLLKTEADDEVIEQHPLYKLFSRPNPLMTYTTFREALVCYLLLSSNRGGAPNAGGGQCFIVPWNSMRNKPAN